MCLAQLKVAFDNAEKVKPGISHAFVAYLIETIRAFVTPFLFFHALFSPTSFPSFFQPLKQPAATASATALSTQSPFFPAHFLPFLCTQTLSFSFLFTHCCQICSSLFVLQKATVFRRPIV